MALNQIPAFVNPANSSTVGIFHTTNTTTTLYTAAANDKVRSFVITMCVIGTAGTDYVDAVLTINSAKFIVRANAAAAPGVITSFSSASLGFDGGFLQAANTITAQTILAAGGAVRVDYSVSIDNYTA